MPVNPASFSSLLKRAFNCHCSTMLPSSWVKTRFNGLFHSAPAFMRCSSCLTFCFFKAARTDVAGVIVRAFPFFGLPKIPLLRSYEYASCLSTVIEPVFMSTLSHVSPSSSLSRRPVNKATVTSCSISVPLAADRIAAVCASSSGLISACSAFGNIQSSAGSLGM